MAATWDTDLVRRVGEAVADEVLASHEQDPTGAGRNVWAPVVNPLRDPRWGRNEEGWSEDPWLTGLLARRPVKVAVIAQAAKTARILWAVLTSGEEFRATARP